MYICVRKGDNNINKMIRICKRYQKQNRLISETYKIINMPEFSETNNEFYASKMQKYNNLFFCHIVYLIYNGSILIYDIHDSLSRIL